MTGIVYVVQAIFGNPWKFNCPHYYSMTYAFHYKFSPVCYWFEPAKKRYRNYNPHAQ